MIIRKKTYKALTDKITTLEATIKQRGYELDEAYAESDYIDMSKFCGRSLHYTKRILAESKELFTDKSGDVYKLRVIA